MAMVEDLEVRRDGGLREQDDWSVIIHNGRQRAVRREGCMH
jgi:hypothetical protein